MLTRQRREYKKRWLKEHPESVSQSNRKQYLKNRETRLDYGKHYYSTHREKVKIRQAAYYRRTYPTRRQKLIADTTAYAKTHPEIRRKCRLNWEARNPDKKKAHAKASRSRRKAMVRGADVSDRTVNSVITRWRLARNFTCYYCGRKFSTNDLHVDHVVPVSRGGKHSTDNICKSCPRCNLSKSDKRPREYGLNGQLLLL